MNIKLNRDMYEVNRMHNGYMLNRTFGIPDSEVVHSNSCTVFITRLLRRFHPFGMVFQEIPMSYCPDVYKTKKPYIDAIFLHLSYFSEIEDIVRESFVFQCIDERNKKIADRMSSENSVSLHIRRGDYLNIPQYAVCDEDYYTKAIEHIKLSVSSPKFYIFSDDPEWCKQFIDGFDVEYEIISHNTGVDSYKDMYLMTQCRHNIIANSTFSWWGAWLNNNTDKIVVGPHPWVVGREYNPCLKSWFVIIPKSHN